MNISAPLLEKKHFPVMLDEVINICNPSKKNQLIIDCTFGGGGYTKELLKFPNIKVIALDRDKSAIERAEVIRAKFTNQFIFYNEKFSNLDKIINTEKKPDVIIFDLGLSTFQLQDYSRGFSFNATDKIDMQMGLSDISAEEVINKLNEKDLRLILKILGEEQEANRIVKNIIKARQVKKINTETTVEVLTPDFLKKENAYEKVLEASPDVFNHNIETVPSLYLKVRPGSRYFTSVELLKLVKKKKPSIFTKSGIMVGLGEKKNEILQVMDDLRMAEVDFLTIGQYLQPSTKHFPLDRYVHPDEFKELKNIAISKGFLLVSSTPLTRSSYHADADFKILKEKREKFLECQQLQ